MNVWIFKSKFSLSLNDFFDLASPKRWGSGTPGIWQNSGPVLKQRQGYTSLGGKGRRVHPKFRCVENNGMKELEIETAQQWRDRLVSKADAALNCVHSGMKLHRWARPWRPACWCLSASHLLAVQCLRYCPQRCRPLSNIFTPTAQST